MASLDGKIAVVTGAGRGIGAAVARRLAADGAEVAINYFRSAGPAQQLAEDIAAAGGRAFTVRGDVADIDEARRMADEIGARTGGVDILVNNAGRGSGQVDSTLSSMSVEDYDATFALNTRGLFFFTQAMLPLLRDGGHIVNLSSTAVMARLPGLAAYAGSKAAVDAFTRVWATELAPRRITVNAIQPGMIDTDLITDNMGDAAKEKAARHHPWGRIGQGDDMADIVAFLVSGDSRWVNGQSIIANGGI